MSEPNPERPPQVLRPVFLNEAAGIVVPLSATVNINPRLDSESGDYVVLWNDIKTVINNPLHLWDGETPVPFLKDENSEFLQPLRISEYPGITLDVVLKASEIDEGMQSLMIRFLETSSSTKPALSDYQLPSETESSNSSPATVINESQDQAKRHQDCDESCDDTQQTDKRHCSCFYGDGHRDTQEVEQDAQTVEDYTQRVATDIQEVEQDTFKVEERIVNINYGRGLSHYNGSYGVPQDFSLAAEYLLKAASQGHVDAQHKLGLMYEFGKGVSQDYAKAAEWYQRAADQGNPDSQSCLGFLYESGLGVPMDISKAVEWWGKAVAQGAINAQFNADAVEYNPVQ
ncbi:hypothetical protein BGX26_002100 [Mortierella sp. AD094]|nr:hypothetical protein BGX26_002100 [Mortierella sp. AD094]